MYRIVMLDVDDGCLGGMGYHQGLACELLYHYSNIMLFLITCDVSDQITYKFALFCLVRTTVSVGPIILFWK